MEDKVRICEAPVNCNAVLKRECRVCDRRFNCDYFWIEKLWDGYENKFHNNCDIGGAIPIVIKDGLNRHQFITYGDNQDNFCFFCASKKTQRIVINDILVAPESMGKGIAKKLIDYLFRTYDGDIFIKCVRGGDAEKFWQHLGEQIQPTMNTDPSDMYEHRFSKDGSPKRDVGWYIVKNPYVKVEKTSLWD